VDPRNFTDQAQRHKYVSHETKALVLQELTTKYISEGDSAVIVNTLGGADDIFTELLRSPNTEVKSWAYELLVNLAQNRSAWMSCLPWTPCSPFLDLLG
jgi:hypothetical protein